MKKINYLQFTAVDGDAKIGLSAATSPDVQYSFDEKNWIVWDYKEITIPNGSTVYLKGNNPNGFSNVLKNNHFMMQGKIEAHGNIMSLIYGEKCDENPTIPNSCCFESLFEGCISLLTAPEMPATTLTERCYSNMFEGCRSLVEAPQLPAMNLAEDCYSGMFRGCERLEIAPVLPSVNLAEECYCWMFNGCKRLVNTPKLPATTLAYLCYAGMFAGCESLVDAPSLPSQTLAFGCYSNMFEGCRSLVEAPQLPATTLAEGCYNSMFEDCESLVMAPKLPARHLRPECYERMFFGCKSLKCVRAFFEDEFHLDGTRDWLSGVEEEGLFVKNPWANWNDRGASGIPKGWKVRTNFKPYRLPDGTFG